MKRRGIKETLLTGALAIFVSAAPAQTTTEPAATASAPALPPPLSPVILAEDPGVVQRFEVNPEAVRQMVDGALLKLTSAPDIGTAWTRLGITPQDIVGIKITAIGGPLFSTHRPIVQAICDGLRAAGVPYSHIVVWDKMEQEMIQAGYVPRPADDSHVAIAAIFPGTGYDPNVTYKNELLGTLIWGDNDFIGDGSDNDLTDAARQVVKNKGFGDNTAGGDSLDTGASTPQTSDRSYYANLLTKTCTKIINVPVLSDNAYVGIEGCLASLALGSVDNSRRFQGDPTYGDPAICEILDRDFIRHKVVIHILDALVAQYAGGPRFDPQFTRSIGAIYVSRDPVAIDTLVLPLLEKWRASDRQGRIDPIGHAASHVRSAASYNLGTDDLHRIQLVRIP
jgi:hypothetical protein